MAASHPNKTPRAGDRRKRKIDGFFRFPAPLCLQLRSHSAPSQLGQAAPPAFAGNALERKFLLLRYTFGIGPDPFSSGRLCPAARCVFTRDTAIRMTDVPLAPTTRWRAVARVLRSPIDKDL